MRHDYVAIGRKRSQQYTKSSKKNRKGNAKKWVKRGAIVVGIALGGAGAAYLIRSGKVDKLAKLGKNKVNQKLLVGEVSKETNNIKSAANELKALKPFEPKNLERPETVEEALKNANPFKNTYEGKNNCANAAIAGFLRTEGKDVAAKTSGGNQQIPIEVAENCFDITPKNKLQFSNGAPQTKRFTTRDSASQYLVERFGNEAKGFVAIKWRKEYGGHGHAFNFEIHNGKVTYMDYKNGKNDTDIDYFEKIDPNGHLTLINLKGATPKWETATQHIAERG